MKGENTNTKSETPKSKLILGTLVLVLSFLSPLLIPFINSSNISDGLKAIISGLLVFGIPELGMLAAVAIMGKDGYEWLKRRFLVLLRIYGPPQVVSPLRYRIGISLFSISLLTGFILPYLLYFFEGIALNRAYIFYGAISLDILLLISLFILGGSFWDKLSGLFNHKAYIRIQ